MNTELVNRFLQSLGALLALSVFVFIMARISGSPADYLLPIDATPEEVEALEDDLGLNEPQLYQYGIYLLNLLKGNLGESVYNGREVTTVFFERFPATLQLTLFGVGLVFVGGIGLGVLSALHRGKMIDTVVRTFAALAQATPSFWLALILMLLVGVRLEWLPVAGRGDGWTDWTHTIMPTFTMSVFALAGVLRLTRSGMLEVLGQEYVTFARSKGLPERVVIMRHALRNALIPVATFGGITMVSTFLAGSIVIESIFAWPGVGQLAYLATIDRDYPTLQGVTLIFGAMFIFANFMVDLSYFYLDPRIRVSS